MGAWVECKLVIAIAKVHVPKTKTIYHNLTFGASNVCPWYISLVLGCVLIWVMPTKVEVLLKKECSLYTYTTITFWILKLWSFVANNLKGNRSPPPHYKLLSTCRFHSLQVARPPRGSHILKWTNDQYENMMNIRNSNIIFHVWLGYIYSWIQFPYHPF